MSACCGLPHPLLASLAVLTVTALRCRFSTGSFDTLITQPKQAGIDPHER
jgi:hypothetical protein